MTEQIKSKDYDVLLLAFIVGLSVNGSFSALFNALVSFSIFPFIALGFALYCSHQRYVSRPIADGTPTLALASCLLGLFLYSAVMRAENAGMGSNFLLTVICVTLVFWLGYKLGITTRKKKTESSD